MNAAEFFHRGVAFLPSNEPGMGDVVITYGKEGEKELEKLSARSYLNQLSRFFGLDLTYMRNRYGQAISKKQMIPLPMALDWTLIPVQVRIPVGKQQTYGWVVKQAIEGVDEIIPHSGQKENPGIKLHLKGRHEILLFHSLAEFRRIIREAQLVELHYQLLHRPPDWVKESKSNYLHFI